MEQAVKTTVSTMNKAILAAVIWGKRISAAMIWWEGVPSTMVRRQAVVTVLESDQAVLNMPNAVLHADQAINIDLAVMKRGIETTMVHCVLVLLSEPAPSQNDHRQENEEK